MLVDLDNPYILDDTGEEVDQVIDLPNKAAGLTSEQIEQFWTNLGGLATAPAEDSAQPITAGAVFEALKKVMPFYAFNFYGDWTEDTAPATEQIALNLPDMVDSDEGDTPNQIVNKAKSAAENGNMILLITQYGTDGWPSPILLYPAGNQTMLGFEIEELVPGSPTGVYKARYRLYTSSSLVYLERRIDNAYVAHWQGSQAAYDAIVTKDPATLYYIV